MSAACPVCQGSGEKTPGYLDCDAQGCEVATVRVALNKKVAAAWSLDPYEAAWIGYQAGQAAALEQAAKVCEELTEEEFETPDGNRTRAVVTQYDCIDAIRALKP